MYESFDDYIDYLNTIKDKIPQHVYEFASNVNRHNLDSPHSLHDSWITSISVREKRNKISPFEPVTSIKIELLGQLHDRDIVLEYEGIKSYSIECVENPYNWADTFHGDIISHEVSLLESDFLLHEILMATEKTIKIVCKNFTCNEQIHT